MSTVTIFVMPAFFSPLDANVTGGYISNYYMAEAASKVSHAYVVAPKEMTSEKESPRGVTVIRHDMGAPTGVRGRHRIIGELRDPVVRLLKKHPGARVKMFFSTTTIPLLLEFSGNPGIETYIICRAYEDFKYGHWNPAPESLGRTLVKRWIDNRRTAAAYLEADSIVVNSHWMATAVRRSFGGGCVTDVLHPPLDIYGSTDFPDKFDGNVIFVGRGRDKGHGVVERLADAFHGVTFHVFGSTNVRSRPNLIIYGWTPREELFSRGSVCVVPSSWPEPFGRVAIEAQAYGLPVLASKLGGLTEAVFDHDLLVESSAPEAWVTGFARFQGASGGYYACARERRDFVKREFSCEAHDEAVKALCTR